MAERLHQGDYSINDPSMSVSLSPAPGLNLSPYAINVDPSLWSQEDEFVFATDSQKTRSWGEKMFYRTGVSYLAGISTGGAVGLYEGLMYPNGRTLKLRWNSVLNSCTRRGPLLANNLGVLAVLYSCIDTVAIKLRGGQDDIFNSVGSAVLTGALYRSTSGLRKIAIAGAAGGCIAASYFFGMYFLGSRHSLFPTRQYT